MLGKVYSGLADLEESTGGRAAAVRFEEVAQGYNYQAGQPESCAISHHNLANSLERQGADRATALAHRLASVLICYQTQSGGLAPTLHNLANADLPPAPPAFADVVKRVEAIEGVRFQALFERLPRTAPDGDAALAAVWQMVAEKRRRDEKDAVLAAAPAAVRAAFEREGDERNAVAALNAALAEMPEAEAAALKQRLREAGLISQSARPDMAQVLHKLEPLLQGIAAAVKDEELRAHIEPVLAEREQKSWRLTEAAHRIWAGERDAGRSPPGWIRRTPRCCAASWNSWNGTKTSRDKTRCWPRPPRPSGRRLNWRATSSMPP